jgi:hypothetical protein
MPYSEDEMQPYPPNPQKLDEGIREVTMFLWNAGFWTFSACEGGEGHAGNLPLIRIYAKPSSTIDRTRVEVSDCLLRAGYRGFWSRTECFHAVNMPADVTPHGMVIIEFCPALPIAPYSQKQIKDHLIEEEKRVERNRQTAIRKAEKKQLAKDLKKVGLID